jgi:hypothetical protein
MADLVQAFDIIQAFMRLTAASHLWEPRALNEPVLPLPVLAHHKPRGALPWPPWRSTRLLARDPAAWDTRCRRRRKLGGKAFWKTKSHELVRLQQRPACAGGRKSGFVRRGRFAQSRRASSPRPSIAGEPWPPQGAKARAEETDGGRGRKQNGSRRRRPKRGEHKTRLIRTFLKTGVPWTVFGSSAARR